MKNKLYTIIFLSLLISTTFGFNIGDEIELDNFVNARSTAKFLKNSNNIRTQLSKGTSGKVSEVHQFKKVVDGKKIAGNSGIKIVVTNGPKKGNSYWVYYNTQNPALKLSDKKGSVLKPSDITGASSAQVTRQVSAIRDPDEAEEVNLKEAVTSIDTKKIQDLLAPHYQKGCFPNNFEPTPKNITDVEEPLLSEASNVEKLPVKIEEEATIVTEKEVSCLKNRIETQEEMNTFISSKKTTGENASIHGVDFKDESPALIEAFKKLTTAYDSFGMREKLSNQKDIQKSYQINPTCDKVACAVQKIWGKEMGLKILYINLRYHFNTSELAFDNSSRFTKSELDDVLYALLDLPDYLKPLGTANQQLVHADRRIQPYKENANALIIVYNNWSKQSRFARRYTLFHELSHNIGDKLNSLDKGTDWLNKSSWVQIGHEWPANWSHNKKACFASWYAKSNPAEDWSESLMAYRYNLFSFKKRCPLKYEYIKNNVFKGQEYSTAKTCTTPDPVALQSDIIHEENKPLPLIKKDVSHEERSSFYPGDKKKLLEDKPEDKSPLNP